MVIRIPQGPDLRFPTIVIPCNKLLETIRSTRSILERGVKDYLSRTLLLEVKDNSLTCFTTNRSFCVQSHLPIHNPNNERYTLLLDITRLEKFLLLQEYNAKVSLSQEGQSLRLSVLESQLLLNPPPGMSIDSLTRDFPSQNFHFSPPVRIDDILEVFALASTVFSNPSHTDSPMFFQQAKATICSTGAGLLFEGYFSGGFPQMTLHAYDIEMLTRFLTGLKSSRNTTIKIGRAGDKVCFKGDRAWAVFTSLKDPLPPYKFPECVPENRLVQFFGLTPATLNMKTLSLLFQQDDTLPLFLHVSLEHHNQKPVLSFKSPETSKFLPEGEYRVFLQGFEAPSQEFKSLQLRLPLTLLVGLGKIPVESHFSLAYYKVRIQEKETACGVLYTLNSKITFFL